MPLPVSAKKKARQSMEVPSLEWYVLRSYRRDDEDPEFVRGIVELVGTQERKSIKSLAELRDILLREGKKRNSVHGP